MLAPTQKAVCEKANVEHLVVSLTEVWKECPRVVTQGQSQNSHSNPGLPGFPPRGLRHIYIRLSSQVAPRKTPLSSSAPML